MIHIIQDIGLIGLLAYSLLELYKAIKVRATRYDFPNIITFKVNGNHTDSSFDLNRAKFIFKYKCEGDTNHVYLTELGNFVIKSITHYHTMENRTRWFKPSVQTVKERMLQAKGFKFTIQYFPELSNFKPTI